MSSNGHEDIKTVSITGCARCGQNHDGLEFKKLKRYIEDTDGTVWDWWVMCPAVDEPILMKMEMKDS